MSLHKELFKDNWAVLSPRNHKVENRKLQQANRAEKRRNLYHQSRNMPVSPKFDDFQRIAAASSTPMPKKSFQQTKTEMDKENCIKTELHIEGEEISSSLNPIAKKLNADGKQSRREAHIKRFIEWKAEKNKLKELEKQRYKPPFISVGKPKKETVQAAAPQPSFAPKNHKFRPPAGLKDPTLQEVKENSVYLPVPTPPKNEAPKESKKLKTQERNFNIKNERKLLKAKKLTLPTESLNITKKTQINVESTSEHDGKIITTTDNKINDIQNNQLININTHPSSSSKQPDTNFNDVLPISEEAKTTIAKHSSKRVDPVRLDTNNKINGIQKHQLLNINKHPSSSIKQPDTNFKDVLPISEEAKTTIAKHSSNRVDPVRPDTNNKINGIQKNQFVKHSKKQVEPVRPDTEKKESRGAAGKVRAMQQRTQNNTKQVAKANEGNHAKPGLVTNFKAKKDVAVKKPTTKTGIKRTNSKVSTCLKKLTEKILSEKTPPESGNCQISTAIITSTLMKPSTSSLSLSTSEFSEISKTISPVEAPQSLASNTKPQQCVSAKRVFNFVKQVQLDETIVDSQITKPIGLDNPRKSSVLAPATNKQPQKKQENKVVSRVLKRLQLQLNMNPNKIQSPKKSKLTPRRSHKLESKNVKKKPTENSKFNFEVKAELDETAVESNDVEMLPGQEVEKCLSKPVKSTSLPQQLEIPRNQERPINYVSPFVSVSRGKVSARKEMEKRNSIYLLETPTKSTVAITVETPVEKRRALEAVRYFRKQLADETQRLHALCDQWNAYKEERLELLQANNGEDMINATIGQTRLLTSKKFMQFKGLISRCEAHANGTAPIDDGSEATKTITPVDLEGFWSMLGLQVENIGKRFENLERWKENDWEDPDAVTVKPRNNNNLKVRKGKSTIAPTNGISKPRVNTALREMMRKRMAEMRAKQQEDTCTAPETQQIQVYNKENTPTSTSHRLRRSTLNTSDNKLRKSFSNVQERILIVVPDRRSRSLARTVISVPSPVRFSPATATSSTSLAQTELTKVQNIRENNLLRTAVLRRSRRSRSLPLQKVQKTPSIVKIDPIDSPPRTPNNADMIQNIPKSILKTPGTARSQSKSVIFNNHLSVRKFRALKYDDDHQGTEYNAIQKVHIDDFAKMKLAPNTSPVEAEDDNEDGRVYRLRNRKIKLRPSCEIELPK